ncbi:MAG: MFS transporter [Rhodobacteraceae bacterium]|nr:MFS transporter [Paracoccaceae bacterium]
MPRFDVDFSAARETLANRNFRIFTAGNAVSLLGTWVQRMAVGWLTWDLTKSGTWLGAVAMAEFLPIFVLAPIMGVITDRFDRRKMAVIGQCFALVQAALLAALTFSGHITATIIFVLQLTAGVIQPLIQTARLVLVPMMLPKNRVGNAVAITSLMFNTARILGPAIGGVIITTVGVGFSFAMNSVSFIGVIVAMLALDLPAHVPMHRGVSAFSGIYNDMTAGWRYTFRHPVLGWLIPTVGLASTLTWPLGDLMAGIADQVYQQDAGGLAMMTSAQGAGAIFGGLILARRPTAEGLSRLVIGAMVMNGVLVAALSLTTMFWLALGVLFAIAFFGVMVGVGSQSLTQTVVSDQMRGRSLSVWYSITRAGPAVGALGIGTLANKYGFEPPLLAAGAITAVVAALTLFMRNLAGNEKSDDETGTPTGDG